MDASKHAPRLTRFASLLLAGLVGAAGCTSPAERGISADAPTAADGASVDGVDAVDGPVIDATATPCPGPGPYPFAPATGLPVCPPYTRPAVFFAPHQDDEVLSMGGAILQHRAAGRDVFVELLTRGQASGARGILGDGGTDDWHPGSHVHPLSEADFSAARDREFLASVERLGVTGVVMNGFTDGALGAAETAARVSFWTSGGHAGLSLKTTTATSADHTVAHDALVSSGFADVRFYGTSSEPYTRAEDISDVCAQKRIALDAYKVWDPPGGRYAVGYHSVRGYFDSFAADCREFVTAP